MKVNLRDSAYVFFEYLFMFAVMIDCRGIWNHLPAIEWFKWINIGLMCFALAGCFICKKHISKEGMRKSFAFVWMITMYTMIFLIINPNNGRSFVRFGCMVCVVYVFHNICDKKGYIPIALYRYENLVLAVCVVSLVFYLGGSVLGIFQSTGTVYTAWTSQRVGTTVLKSVPTYYNLYFETQKISEFGLLNFPRNTAIFTEAPMCSLHFCIALMIELLLKESSNRYKTGLLIVGILTTFSTTGYIVVILIFLTKYLSSHASTKGFKLIKILIIPIVIIFAILAVSYFITTKLGTGSGSTRLDDFMAGYKAWVDSPVFGNGYNNSASYQKYMSSFRKNNMGFSNSPFCILAYGGLYLFAPYLYCFIRGMKKYLKLHSIEKTGFLIIFALLFTVTIIPFQALTIYMLLLLSDGINTQMYS